MDELEAKRRSREGAGVRRVPSRLPLPSSSDGPPAWVTKFVIPRNACEPCTAHLHHRCHGVNLLLDPIPECPCDCGDARDPMILNARAWADMAVHAPDQVWIAAMFERQRAAGIHMCSMREDGTSRSLTWRR